jgi:hypothetical protein
MVADSLDLRRVGEAEHMKETHRVDGVEDRVVGGGLDVDAAQMIDLVAQGKVEVLDRFPRSGSLRNAEEVGHVNVAAEV